MMGQDRAGHHGNPPLPGRLGALGLSLLDALLYRRTPQSPNIKSKVNPLWSKRSIRNYRTTHSIPRSKDGGKNKGDGSSSTDGYSPTNLILRRSSSAKQLKAGWSTKRIRLPSVSHRNVQTKVAVNNSEKYEAPEVVSNYVYDVPETKPTPKPAREEDSDDSDDRESDDFDLNGEEGKDGDDLDFEMRPYASEDDDEMAYFAHKSGGPDFKMLRRRVLHPHGRIRAIWDTITLLLTTWILVIIPFELCFDMNNVLRRSLLHLDLFVDSIFAVDIILNFNTAVEDDGKLHFSHTSIVRHYTRGWFVPEILWTIPFYAIVEGHDPEAYKEGGSATTHLYRFSVQVEWLYPAARCLRLLRVVGLPRLQRRLERSLLISSKVSSLGSFLFVVLALSHVFSCVFAYLAFNDEDQLEYALSQRVLQDAEVKTRYIAAFYWSMMTMTTVGYGDITVKTNPGRLFSIAAMIVGAGVFAYGITNVVSLFQQLYEHDTAYRRDMDKINDFMQARMLPPALRDKIRANTFYWRKAARAENKERDRAIVERMANLIRSKVADRFCEDMMPRKMPFLAGCSAEFIHDLYLRMRVQCYLPGEDIITQGEYGSEMYFLFVGHAQVLLGLTKVALFGPNSCFGEFSIANPRKPRLATIQALDFCETHCVDREQILRVLLAHPLTMRSARQLATLRSRKALTLIYESGGKSRTLLQGLAMMWRGEGVESVLPAGVSAQDLPFLQEFTATPKVSSSVARRSSSVVASNPQLQPNQLYSQQQLDPTQYGASLPQPSQGAILSPSLSTAALAATVTGSVRRPSLVLDRANALTSSPSLSRPRSGIIKLPKIDADGPTESGLPLEDKETVKFAMNGTGQALTRRVSTTSIPARTPLVVPPVTVAPPPQDDRLDLLLAEIRNVASRQNFLEQQLKAMLPPPQTKPPLKLELSRRRLDSGTIAMERGRFDEQHWIDDHAPIVRERSSRHITLGNHQSDSTSSNQGGT